MDKFNRVYSLKVEVDNGANVSPLLPEFRANKNVEVTLPFTLEFTITRRNLAEAQTGRFRLYNLGDDVRDAIRKDMFNQRQVRAIQLRAGYAPNGDLTTLPLMFNGIVQWAFSFREGNDWITEIDAYDGGFAMANGYDVSATFGAGTSAATAIRYLARLLPRLSAAPVVGDFPTVTRRGEVFFGNIWNLIQEKSGGLAIVDNGRVLALQPYEVLGAGVTVLSPESGIIGTPKRTRQMIEVDMLLEPELLLAQTVELRSLSDPKLNRPWKVAGVSHQGTISPSIAGDCTTTASLWFFDGEFKPVLTSA